MANKKILIVDDDEAILESFNNILESAGFVVEMAKTGNEALEKSSSDYYDLAMLDIKLPDMDGTDLLRKMHRSKPSMMKIMVTGHASLDNAVSSLNQGADAYLMKPVSPDTLLETVENKLTEQEEAESMSEERVTQWVEARIRKLEHSNED